MKDYAVFLLDWDGTVSDTLQVWMDAIQKTLEGMGLTLPTEAVIAGLGDWDDMIPFGFPKKRMEEFASTARSEAKKQLANAPLYDNAKETIELLRAKSKKVALVTASHGPIILPILKFHGLSDHFDVIVSGSDVTKHKPDPEGLLIALERLGNPSKDSVVMVGDSPRDLGAAQNAGVDSILYNPPSHNLIHDAAELQSFSPVLTVQDWASLQEILQ